MNILIACGSPWCQLEDVFSIMQRGGVATARPPERGSAVSIASWHAQLLTARSVDGDVEQFHPGKAWELAASEIFLANWNQNLWGWADTRSASLLEFWRDFDPNTRFVLLYTHPEKVLARVLSNTIETSLDTRRTLDTWLAYGREMLRFHNRNRERSVLIDAGEALSHPRSFLAVCAASTGMALDGEPAMIDGQPASENPLSVLLARDILKGYPEVDDLRLELEASVTRCFLPDSSSLDQIPPIAETQLEEAIAELQGLFRTAGPTLDEHREANRLLQADQERLTGALQRLDTKLADEAKVRTELETLATQRLAVIEELTRKQSDIEQRAAKREHELQADLARFRETAELERRRMEKEFRHESELVLLQLHQTQEQLEQHFTQNESLRTQLCEKDEAIDEYVRKQAESEARITQFEKERAELTKSRDEATNRSKERQARIQTLEQDMAVLVKCRDEAAQLAAERGDKLQSLEQENAALTASCDAATKTAADLQAKMEALNSERGKLKANVEELTRAHEEHEKQHAAAVEQFRKNEQELHQGHELVLLQLHQTQEELERYFTKNQSLQARLTEQEETIAEHVRGQSEHQRRIEAMEKEKTALAKSRDEAAKQATERQARIQSLEQEKTELTKSRQEVAQQASERQARIHALEQERAALAQSRDEATKQAAERQTRIQNLEQERTALTKSHQEVAQQASERQTRIHALEQERAALAQSRDEATKQATERQTRIQSMEQEKAALTKARDAATKQTAELQARIDALGRETAKLAADLDEKAKAAAERDKLHTADLQRSRQAEQELRQENELLMFQLHQVQEELQHHYLKCIEVEKKAQEQTAPWLRFLERHPEYADWKTIEVVANEHNAMGPRVRWRISGLNVGGRALPDFEVTTAVHNRAPALILDRPVNGNDSAPLLRWPTIKPYAERLVLQPQGEEADRHQRWAALGGLAASDWSLSRALCSTLSDALQTQSILVDNVERPDSGYWLSQLAVLRKEFLHFPAVWRYDQVTLKHEQVNPDYEHLWLRITHVSFADRHWPEFEFRLGAAAISAEAFSMHPKLEFPQMEQEHIPFENWFVESHDDHGPKLELRFELSGQAMDIGVWNRLSPFDHALVFAIAGSISQLLNALEAAGTKISRPWADWRHLAQGMISVMRLRLAEETDKPESAPPPPTRKPATKRPVPGLRSTERNRTKRVSATA